jgi:glycosyltransferase involved in cell wall biosynthesis
MADSRGKIVVLGGYTSSLVNFRGELLRAMVERGWEVVGCAPEEDAATTERLAAMGVRFRQVPLDRTGTNPMKDLASVKHLAKVFREERPDKLLAYTIKPVIYGTMAAARAGVPERYSMITGLGSAFEKGGFKKQLIQTGVTQLYRNAAKLSNRLIVQNPDDRADLIRLGIGSSESYAMVNGSGVDCDRFPEIALPPPPVRFLCISRLIGDKGVREFAAAAKIVKAKHPEVRFDLVGPRDTNPSAIPEAEVREWCDSGALVWHGGTDDVRPYIADCSVYVLPSYREGTPRTVLEALATGRAIITTDAPGCRETIEDGVEGFLVQPRDVDSLAAAMEKFAKNPSLVGQCAERARARALSKYDVRKVNAEVLRIMGA